SRLPASQVRALHPDRASFVDRHGVGPSSPSALRSLLSRTRQRGWATEDGEVTPGLSSVAAAVLDHNGHPVAGVAVTFPTAEEPDGIADEVTTTAAALSERLSWGSRVVD